MQVRAEEVEYKKKVGKLGNAAVIQVGLKGGLHLVMVAKEGKLETLGAGPHPAVARFIAKKKSEDKIDFPALGAAIHSIKLGTVDLKRLAQKHGDTEFLTDLIRKEMGTEDHPDALVFAGPKVMLDEAVPQETLKPLADVDYPVFYMNYALNPAAVPWKDSISRAIKVFKGTEYTISRPRDLWFAMSEMVGRIVKSKHGRSSSQVSAQ